MKLQDYENSTCNVYNMTYNKQKTYLLLWTISRDCNLFTTTPQKKTQNIGLALTANKLNTLLNIYIHGI